MNITDKFLSLDSEKKEKFFKKIAFEGEKYGVYPLTPNQYSLWCKHKVSEDITQFTTPCFAIRFENIDEAKLTKAVNSLFELEEVFQYRFLEIDGNVYQYIDRNGKIPLRHTDISSNSDIENAIKDVEHRFYKSSLKLKTDYPVVFELLKFSESKFILFICIHHLIADAASVGVILRDLFALIEDKIPKKNARYGSYAMYKNSPDGTKEQMQNEQYWIEKIENVDKVVSLPTDFERNSNSFLSAGVVDIKLTKTETINLRNAAKSAKTNMHVILSTLFSLVVQSFAQKNDFIIATTFFNRKNINYTSIVGDFASIVPYVFCYDQNAELDNYIKNNATIFLDAMDNSDVVFSRISDTYKNSRVKYFNPLYQIAMVYHSKDLISIDTNHINDIKISIKDLATEDNICDFEIDLYMKVTDLGNSINISAVYPKNLFKRSTIENLTAIYLNLLRNFDLYMHTPLKDIVLAEKSLGIPVKSTITLKKYRPASITCAMEYTYNLGNSTFCVLNKFGIPVPLDFYGEIFILDENEWFSSGKYGRVRNDKILEINEQLSWIVTFCGKVIDIKSAYNLLNSAFPYAEFEFKYVNNKTFILDYTCEKNEIDICSIEKVIGFKPSLIYRCADFYGDKLLKHQKNILTALIEIDKLGCKAEFIQQKGSDVTYITFSSNKAPSREIITNIDYKLRDEKIFFGFGSSELNLKETHQLFIYPKQEHSINEKKLIKIWNDILKTNDFDIYDSFHSAGGDSLKIYQLLNHINKCFDIDVGISNLFTYNTIHDMAKYINKIEKHETKPIKKTCIMCF